MRRHSRRHWLVRAWRSRGVRIASVCSGAYILAEAGLLDGCRATTHWQRTRHFLKTYPQVKLSRTAFSPETATSGLQRGSPRDRPVAGDDREDYEEIAQKTARQLVLYHRRSGGQSQFSSLLELKAPNGCFRPLLAGARASRSTVDGRGHGREQAGMSARRVSPAPSLRRRVPTPSKAVERLRIEVARQRVQSSSEAIERVAELTGFRGSGADAPRLHPCLRPVAAIVAARRERVSAAPSARRRCRSRRHWPAATICPW